MINVANNIINIYYCNIIDSMFNVTFDLQLCLVNIKRQEV